MYLFTRSVRLNAGSVGDQMAWALAITEKVNQITELDVGLWSPVFSPALGTAVWTAASEDLELLELTDTKLMTDSGYLNLLDEGQRFINGAQTDDALIQLVHPAEAVVAPDARYVAVVESAMLPGQMMKAFEVGVKIAELAKATTGFTTQFGMSMSGRYGGVVWATLYDTVQELQRSGEAINSSPDFVALIYTEAGGAFDSSVTTQTMYRRIA